MPENSSLVFVLNNIRSAHNVGSVFRSADGMGASKIYCVGYTPVPADPSRKYLTIAEKELKKTALGAETWIPWESRKKIETLVRSLKKEGFQIVGLELAPGSVDYGSFVPERRVALILGNEVEGIPKKVLDTCDVIMSIPMRGRKESLSVSVAAAVAGYGIRGKMKGE